MSHFLDAVLPKTCSCRGSYLKSPKIKEVEDLPAAPGSLDTMIYQSFAGLAFRRSELIFFQRLKRRAHTDSADLEAPPSASPYRLATDRPCCRTLQVINND